MPTGIHPAEWSEVQARFGGSPHRAALLTGLYQGLRSLADAGCVVAYVDGSFVTSKVQPGDFDVCWDPRGVDPGRLDPVLLVFANKRAAQQAKFGGEFFPSTFQAAAGAVFLDFFQINKHTGNPKGIVSIDLRRLP